MWAAPAIDKAYGVQAMFLFLCIMTAVYLLYVTFIWKDTTFKTVEKEQLDGSFSAQKVRLTESEKQSLYLENKIKKDL